MEPTKAALSEKQITYSDGKVRFKLLLGKYRIVKVEMNAIGPAFALDLGSGAKMVIQGSNVMDVREGDLLTLYTEVLAHAQPSQTSVK